MKGAFFNQNREYRLETEKESWAQGDPIRGALSVRLHGAAPAVHAKVLLAHGDLKAVRAKSADAFEVLAEAAISDANGGQWEFPTDRNVAITDSGGSLFLLYGAADAPPESLGQLQLTVKPAEVVEKFLDVLRTRFRFVQKFVKAEKHGMHAKLMPPESKALAFVEQLILRFSFADEALNLTYEFTVHAFEATESAVASKKKKKKREIQLSPADYRTASGRWNDERFEAEIASALAEVSK